MTLCGSLCATPPPPASRGATDPPTHCQMDLQAFAKLAKLRGVERSGLSNEVRLWIRSVWSTSTARHANSALPPQAVFRQLDGDGSNDLSKAEVAGLKELVDQHNAKKAASQNPDEMVTFEEFEQLFQPGGKRRLPHTHPPLPHNRSNISSAIRKLCRRRPPRSRCTQTKPSQWNANSRLTGGYRLFSTALTWTKTPSSGECWLDGGALPFRRWVMVVLVCAVQP